MATGSILFRSADGRTAVIDDPANGDRIPLPDAGVVENNTDRELRLHPPAAATGGQEPAVLRTGGTAQVTAGSTIHVI
ncbi:hypothetical protein [Streptomyces sp. MP131-18]|uniref:hypothetical protein n=1 Tax=Streptomyces sp. MP131-18 TaxID=1857892 RepID=UPI00097BF565|nr:hypothetical protein [Streptomyces sp. MP131-18]ONK12663.1 hypothetical protein STBA_34110 [Streptomyces sp. MP131-18]